MLQDPVNWVDPEGLNAQADYILKQMYPFNFAAALNDQTRLQYNISRSDLIDAYSDLALLATLPLSYEVKPVGEVCKKLSTGYGIKIGRYEGLYVMPKIKGFVLLNWKLKNGQRFAIQYGHWLGIGKTPWYKRLYLKLPGKTNNHWPWGRP